MTGQLNRRVTIKTWTDETDVAGGVSSIVRASYTIWAKVDSRNGSMFTSEQQALWNYDYKVTFRYEASRVVKSNMTIDYDNKRMSIKSISFLDEGKRKYCIARCSTTDDNILEGDSNLLLGETDISGFPVVIGETLSGAIDGVNLTFTTEFNFLSNRTKVYLNGERQNRGILNDYTEQNNNEIVFNIAPKKGVIIIDYIKV